MGIHAPLMLQPGWHSLSGQVLHTLSKTQFLRNHADDHEGGFYGIALHLFKVCVITPLLTACATLDVLWWTCKTITVYPVYVSGIKSHVYDLAAFVFLPITALFYTLLGVIPPSPRPLAFHEIWPVLHRAVHQNDPALVKRLIAEGANINECAYEVMHIPKTPLDVAIERGFEEIVILLLDQQNIDVNPDHKDSFTTLELAMSKLATYAHIQQQGEVEKYVRIIKRLLQKNADPCHVRKPFFEIKSSPLSYFLNVVPSGVPSFNEILEAMLKKGGDPNLTIYNSPRGGVVSLLMYSIPKMPKPTVELLIKYGAKVHTPNHIDSPIKRALKYKRDDLLPLLIEALQKQGAEQNMDLINYKNSKSGTTPIVHACMHAHAVAVEMLRKAGARLEIGLDEGVIDVIKLIRDVRIASKGYSTTDKVPKENVVVLVNKAILFPRDQKTHPNMFINAIRFDVFKTFIRPIGLPKLAAIESLLLAERKKERVEILNKAFEAYATDINMPKELIAMIAEY